MKKIAAVMIVLVLLLLGSSFSWASPYYFNVSYDTVGHPDVDYVPKGYSDTDTANITDFLVTSSDIVLDPNRATYCVDLYNTITAGAYYGILLDVNSVVTDPSGNTRTYANAATLLEQYGQAYDSDNDNLEEQLQLSIWETLYETEGTFSLADGVFSSDDYIFLTLGSNIDISNYRVLRFTDENGNSLDKQDLLVKVSNVPIPGAVWLLGSGLVGLVGIRRRKSQG